MSQRAITPTSATRALRRRRDRGATLIEMVLAVSLVGIIMAAVSTAVVVLLRNSDDTTVQHVAVTTQTGRTRIEYRTQVADGEASLAHRVCERDDTEAPFGTAQRIRIADRLDPADPVRVEWVGDRVELNVTQAGGNVASLAATPFRPDAPLVVASPDPDEETPVATFCPANPNEVNEGFMVMTEGHTTFHNGANESYGPVAVGGDLTFKNYNSSTQSGGTFFADGDGQATTMLVGGMVNWPDSGGGYLNINNGYIHVGDISNWTPHSGGPNNQLRLSASNGAQNRQIRVNNTDQTYASVEMPDLFDFADAFRRFRTIGTALEDLPGSCEGITDLELFGQNGVGEWTGGNVWLYFAPGQATLLTMTMAEYASIGNVNLKNGSAQPTQDTPFIINITDGGTVTMPSGETNISRNHIPHVLWNFPNATQVNTGGAFWGGLLAPNAVVVQNGDISGNVIAAGLVSNAGIISMQAFEGDFPWSSPGE